MRTGDLLVCRTHERRLKLFGNTDWNGLDYLDVLDDQRTLCVHFFGPVPEGFTPANVCIEGGRRIRDLRVVDVEIHRSNDPEVDDCLRITVDRPGDFSTYRLCLVDDGERCHPPGRPPKGIDPRFACLDFTFKVNCPTDLDCRRENVCATSSTAPPDINYLAKDYSTFRQLILDRLALIMPAWRERHVPDIGITLVEVLAYVGDYLSYYQDAVATEAYLDTARQRISVRRHARLVDYRLHEGVNARAWVTVETATDLDPLPARNVYFITGFPDIQANSGRVVKHADLDLVPRTLYEVFEPVVPPDGSLHFLAAHSRIRFYTWGEHECCLATGATRATLVDGEPQGPDPQPGDTAEQKSSKPPEASSHRSDRRGRILNLQPGDVLILEEVIGPNTGNPADADPSHRHAVRLTSVTPLVDELLGGTPVLDVEWAREDALPFSLCLSSRLPAPDCRRIDDVSVARGNVVLVDHGRTEQQDLEPVEEQTRFGDCRCDGSLVEWTTVPAPFNPSIDAAPLTFAEPAPANDVPASLAVQQDTRRALPAVRLVEYRETDRTGQSETGSASGWRWDAREDLLGSGAEARHFVAEIDDEGYAHLRFGDGELGRQPASGVRFQATYRTGNGPDGNVGRETISYLVLREGSLSADAILPTNPLPSLGGTLPEPLAEAKLIAPQAFRERLERAITGSDYGTLARRHPRVHRALGELLWTGSWYEARVSIDPAGAAESDPVLLDAVHQLLHRYRRIGHDLAVVPARYVPLDIALEICVCPQAEKTRVKAALLDTFSNRTTAHGTPGFFHPDTLSFADGVYLSRLVARAQSIPGVELARVVRCQRLAAPAGAELETGVLVLDGMEVARLDNDPDFPENGTLELIMRGGR